MHIYLIRHGESVDDLEDAYGGIADYPLSEAGQDMAQRVAQRLQDSGIQALYSSPYLRAKQTADAIAAKLGCPLRVMNDLRERNSFGILSGTTKEKARQIFGHILKDWKGRPGDYYSDELLPGAEPLDLLHSRVREVFSAITAEAQQQAYHTIGLVTHGNVTRAFYRTLLGQPGKIELDFCAITQIEYQPAQIRIAATEGIQIL